MENKGILKTICNHSNFIPMCGSGTQILDELSGEFLTLVPTNGALKGAAGRNNNPGNITCSRLNQYYGQVGKDGRWPTFASVPHGIRAWFSFIERKRPTHQTIRKMWYMYAPPNENNTEKYIGSLSKTLGMSPDSILPPMNQSSKNLYWTLARACFKIECSYIPDDNTLQKAWNMYIQNPNLM